MVEQPSSIPAETLRLLEARAISGPLPQVLVLPSQVRKGRANYSEFDLEAVKIAREAGIDADFLDGPQDRKFLGEYGADLAISFAIAVAQQLTADGVIAVGKYIRAQLFSLHSRGLISSPDETKVRIAAKQVDVHSGTTTITIKDLDVEAVGEAAITQLIRGIAGAHAPATAIRELNLPPDDD